MSTVYLKYGLILLWSILSTISVQSRESRSQLYFRHLDRGSGLPEPVIRQLFADSEGFLWIGTENGLWRFDGSACVRYGHDERDAGSISGNFIVNIIEDSSRNLWIGTQKGLSLYIRSEDRFRNFRNLRSDVQIPENHYSFPFFIDDRNRVWVYISGRVFTLDTTDMALESVSANSNGYLFVRQPFYTSLREFISRGVKGIYVAQIREGREISCRRFFMDHDAVEVEYVLPESDTLYWLCTDEGLIALNPQDSTYVRYAERDGTKLMATCIVPAPGQPGRYLVASKTHGLLLFCGTERRFLSARTHDPFDPGSPASGFISRVLADSSGNLFLALPGYGVDYARLDIQVFPHYLRRSESVAAGLSSNSITAIAARSDGQLYLGTKDDGLLVFDPHTGSIKGRYLKRSSVTRIFRLDNTRLLVSLADGSQALFKEGAVPAVTPLKVSAPVKGSVRIHQLLYMPDRVLVAATEHGAATVRFPAEGIMSLDYTHPVNSQLEWAHIQSVIPVGTDSALVQTFYTDMWRCAYRDGVLQDPEHVAMTSFATHGMLSYNFRIYLATSSGMQVYDRLRNRIKSDVFPDLYCSGIAADSLGWIWVTSTQGVYGYHPLTGARRHYTTANGLQGYTYNTGSILSLENGAIAAGGINGLNLFYPVAGADSTHAYGIYIAQASVNDSTVPGRNLFYAGEMHLRHDEHTISFRCIPVSYTPPGQELIRYQLIGYDEKPVTVSGAYTIRYTHLPPGSYTLELRSADGILKRSVSIHIAPPFWKTWWFYMLLVAAAVLAVFAVVRIRVRKEKQIQLQRLNIMIRSQEEERKRIARDLHDDFGARLSALKLYVQASDDTDKNPVEIRAQAMGMIDQAIRELRNILLNLSPKTLAENGLGAALQDMADNLSRLGIISCSLDTVTLKKRLPPATEYALYRIGQELINNTIRHAAANHIYLSLVVRDGVLVFLYEDDGKGFDKEQVRYGYGITNIETHVQALRGNIYLDTEPGKGLAVTIEIGIK